MCFRVFWYFAPPPCLCSKCQSDTPQLKALSSLRWNTLKERHRKEWAVRERSVTSISLEGTPCSSNPFSMRIIDFRLDPTYLPEGRTCTTGSAASSLYVTKRQSGRRRRVIDWHLQESKSAGELHSKDFLHGRMHQFQVVNGRLKHRVVIALIEGSL